MTTQRPWEEPWRNGRAGPRQRLHPIWSDPKGSSDISSIMPNAVDRSLFESVLDAVQVYSAMSNEISKVITARLIVLTE